MVFCAHKNFSGGGYALILCTYLKTLLKKIKRLKIAPIASITHTTDVYPLYPTIDNHFYALIFICNHLWESFFCKSFWISFIRENLFLLCESFWMSSYCVKPWNPENIFKPFLFVKISFYLCLFVRNPFLFMLTCENLFD